MTEIQEDDAIANANRQLQRGASVATPNGGLINGTGGEGKEKVEWVECSGDAERLEQCLKKASVLSQEDSNRDFEKSTAAARSLFTDDSDV